MKYTELQVKQIIEFVIEKVDRYRAIHRVYGISDGTYETIFSELSDWYGEEIGKLNLTEELYDFIDELD
jgi:hypothetical protein